MSKNSDEVSKLGLFDDFLPAKKCIVHFNNSIGAYLSSKLQEIAPDEKEEILLFQRRMNEFFSSKIK